MTQVNIHWFPITEIARALGISREEARLYCDRATYRATDGTTSVRVFAGGYGINIIEKGASAEKLAAHDSKPRRG